MIRKGNVMRIHLQFVFGLSLFAATACSAAPPPMIGDSDSGLPPRDDAALGACEVPAPGCPCTDPGKKIGCGTIYRKSGTHVDCSEGYITCQDDGEWSDCVGPTVWDGG